MASRDPKVGAKGVCRHCGMYIEARWLPTGRGFFRPEYRSTWVHVYRSTGNTRRHCPGAPVAEPRPHMKKAVV